MLWWLMMALVGFGFVGYALIAWLVALRMSKAERRAPPHDELVGFDTVRFYSRRDNVLLTASYVQADQPRQVVVLVHGRGGCRGFEFDAGSSSLVSHLVQHGLSVLLLDLRGHGESGAARLTYGIRERFDVLGAVDWLLDRGFQPGQVGVLGASMGAVSAILAAVDDASIGAVVADSAFADFASMMKVWFRRMSGLPNVFLQGALLIGRVLIKEDLRRLRPVESALRLGAPLLVIHALEDRLVPHGHAQALVRAARAEYWFTPGRKHLAAFQDQPVAYAQRVTAFFAKHLGQPQPAITAQVVVAAAPD